MNQQPQVETATAQALTLRCTQCGALAQPGCNCGARYEYMSPGKLAERTIKANLDKSDRAIAAELGVSTPTVSRARKATVTNVTVGKRTGRDGKARRMPRGGRKRNKKAPGVKQAQRSIDLHPDIWAQVKARSVAASISTAELIGRLLTNVVEPNVDPKTLPKTAQDKLAVAARQQRRQQDQEFEARIQTEFRKRNEKQFPDMQKRYNDAYQEKEKYEKFLKQQKKMFTPEQFTAILRCLHPDSRKSASDAKLAEAFRLLESKKFAMTGEE